MQPSRHNILTQLSGREEWLLVNLLSGEADLLDADEAERLRRGEPTDEAELARKGYWVEPAEEERRLRRAYLDFLDARATDEVQLFYVGSYACNFACSYCYQDQYPGEPAADADAVLDAFFAYVDTAFRERRKYVTLFGGEPLLPSVGARHLVTRLVEETRRRELDLAVVTNGYHLASYVPLLARGHIREIQVTLDGTERVHDRRRYLKGGGATFRQVVAGIDAALAQGLPVNLRTVLDRENLQGFAELARFAIAKGWSESALFKTQIGRNYELHHCQLGAGRLHTRLSLHEELFRLIEREPEILRFHRPAFSVARRLFEEGQAPDPLFDACPACKTEWAFDATGRIYPCTANVGKPGEALGRFYPSVELDRVKVEAWENRDVLSLAGCRGCPSQLACGGGCGAVAKNRGGDVNAPDCRPVRELLALGGALYGQKGEEPCAGCSGS